MPPPLLALMLLDAQADALRAAHAVPDSERTTGVGSPAWIVAHAAVSQDAWVNAWTASLAFDPWTEPVYDALYAGSFELPYAETLDAMTRIFARADGVLEGLTADALQRTSSVPPDTPWTGASVGFLLASAAAHLYIHAADLNARVVTAGGEDLDMPRLNRTRQG